MFAPLRNRDFAFFWTAAAISNAGNWMQALSIPYIVYQLTNSNTWLGLTGAAVFLPCMVGTACIGALVDRYDRRRLLLVLQLVQMTAAAAVWVAWVAGVATPLNIVVLAAINGFVGGMVNPAWNSFIPMLVPREIMAGAIRLNAMQFAFGRALGPVLASAVLHPFGPGATLFINVASFGFVIGVLVVLHPKTTPPVVGESPWRQAIEGWRYVLARRSLMVVPLTMLVSGFFGSSLIQLASALSEEQFGHDPSSFGLLVGSFGLGSVIGSFLVSGLGDRLRRSTALFWSFGFWAAGLVVLAASPNFAVGLLGLGLMGTAHVGTATTMSTSLNLQVDEAYRGRAAVAHMQGILLGVGLGSLGLAWLADATSLPTMEYIAAGAMVVFLVIGAKLFANFRLIDPNGPAIERASSRTAERV